MARSKVKSQPNKGVKKKKPKVKLPGWYTNFRLHLWIVFFFGFLLYANTFTHDYTQDDAIVITDNMYTEAGVNGIPGILSKDTFFGFFKEEGKANLVAGGRYRPFTLVLFAIEYQIFGENPTVGHVMNALLYGITGVLLYLVLLEFFSSPKSKAKAYWIALTGAVIFVAHPLHTEAVANIKGRDEIAALLFSLAALYLSLKAFQKKKLIWNIGAAILFFIALLSKENAITFLAVTPLAYYFFTKSKAKQIALQTVPFILSAIVFLIIRSSVLGGAGLTGNPSLELMNNPFLKWTGSGYVLMSFGEKMATIMFTLGKYLQLLFVPYPLTHDYYPRHIEMMSWMDWRVLLSMLAYVGLGIYAVLRFPKKDPVSFGILYFLITLSIVSNVVFPVGTNMSERFLFMPSVGFCIVIAVLTYRLSQFKKRTDFKQVIPYLGLVVVITLLFSGITFARNFAWKDNYTLFTTDIHKSPNSAKLRNAVGGELTAQSINADENTREAMLTEAIGHLQEAVKIHPTYKNAYLLLGNAHSYLEQYQQAIAYYDKALELDPNYQQAIQNKAVTYRNQGRYYGEEKNNLAASLQSLEKAYQLNPNDYETLRLLGVANGIRGNSNNAISFFEKALALEPENADALFNLGTAHYAAGNEEKGAAYHLRARQIDPSVGQPGNN